MNSQLFQFRYSAERDMVELFLKFSVAAAGAPTVIDGKGILSIARNSAGRYTITLRGNANRLLGVDAMQIVPTTGISAAPIVGVVSEAINAAGNGSLIVQYADAAGVAADMASGEISMLRITVRNAST